VVIPLSKDESEKTTRTKDRKSLLKVGFDDQLDIDSLSQGIRAYDE
jgi:hypothetical protein